MSNIRQQWNETCLDAGIPSISTDTAAHICAAILHYGDNEALTHCPKLSADIQYIQRRFGVFGGMRADVRFGKRLRMYSRQFESCDRPPDETKKLFMYMYNIEI